MKKSRLLTMAVAAASLAVPTAFVGVGSVSAATTDPIVEGYGTSQFHLGMARSELVAAFPNSDCDTGSECFAPGYGGYVGITFSSNTVNRLEFTNSSDFRGWYTAAGVQPASTLDDIAAIYGATVDGDTVDVSDEGYIARDLTTYACGDTGCRPSGAVLRHYIFAADGGTGGGGGGGETVAEVQGDIVIHNTARKALRTTVTLTVQGPSGGTVATQSLSVNIPGRSSMSIDPATVIDVDSAAAGTYDWTASVKKGRKNTRTIDSGSFDVVYVQQ